MTTIECPFCYEILDIQPPDKLHTAFSLEKPIQKSYHGQILKKKLVCQNPNCNKSITVYWYAPLEYFNRI
jgi:hypothetical protein